MSGDLLQDFESFGRSSLNDLEGINVNLPSSSPVNPFDDIPGPSVSVKPSDQFQVKRRTTDYPILRHSDTTRIRVSGHVTHVAVTNNIATMCYLGNSIFRYDLNTENSSESCEIKRDDDARIYKIFQDPKAQFLLVCMTSRDSLYITKGGQRRPQARPLPKLRGYLVESVAWNLEDQTDQVTGPILIGTNEGIICETIIDNQEKRKGYCVQVYELMQDMGHVEPITGMQMQLFPENFGGNTGKWFVLVTTPSRIYQFIGNSTKGEVQFLELFAFYKDYVKIQFQEIPGVLKDSKLCLWPQKHRKLPSSLAWLTGAGVYYGTLAFGSHEPGESLLVEKNLIPYSIASENGDEKDAKVDLNQKDSALPIGLALTEFHCILLFREKIVAICHLNNKKVFEEPFNIRRHGPLTGMCNDPVTGNIWTWAKMILNAYHPHREGRNVWKIYLDKGRFLDAQRHAEGNQEYLDQILVRKAEHHFKEGKYEDAAEDFSKSHLSFEEVALKFLQVNKKEALKKFLLLKLNSLTEQDKTQRTMLTVWLIEMYLNELGMYKDSSEMDIYLKLQEEFHDFLQKKSLRDCLYHNSGTIYDLMLSHGATEDVIFFAKLMEDYERVIAHHIQQYQFEEALETLRSRSSHALRDPDKSHRRAKFQKLSALYYKFSPVLVKHIPQATVEAWILCERHLDPKRLIPSLIQCSQSDDKNQATSEEQNAAAIQYLQFCVDKLRSSEPSVHNFLVSSYANSKDPADHKKLREYLVKQEFQGVRPQYDVQYALRMCLEKGLHEACVYIYSAMGLFEECVTIALKHCGNVELARRMASSNPLIRKDDLLQKKLWLKIAEYLIKKEKDIEKAMQFLKECDVLKIEDILPFFEDVVTIDQFKEAICDSLESYNSHIDNLKKEMDIATTSAKNIRSDIQEIRNKCVLIRSVHKCDSCEGRLLAQSFYMFPCRHSFHHDCLVGELSKLLAAQERSLKGHSKATVKIEDVGSDCPYCGVYMISSISIPLIPLDNLDAEMMKWY